MEKIINYIKIEYSYKNKLLGKENFIKVDLNKIDKIQEELKHIIIFGEFSKKNKNKNKNKNLYILNKKNKKYTLKKTKSTSNSNSNTYTNEDLGMLINIHKSSSKNNEINLTYLSTLFKNSNLKNTNILNLLDYIKNPKAINDLDLDQIFDIFSNAHFLQMDSLMELLIKRLIDLKIYNTYFD